MTLRRRLVVTLVVLVAVGLAAVDVVIHTSLHSYLYGRTDSQLTEAGGQAYSYILREDLAGRPVSTASLSSRVNPDVYVEVLDSSRHVLLSRPSGTRSQQDPPPLLPAQLPVQEKLDADDATSDRGSYRPASAAVNVGSMKVGGPTYRLQAAAVPGGTLIVATPLNSVTATLRSLRNIEVAVSVAVILLLAVLTALIVRRDLRPIEAMTADADAIAGGDLTRRVESAEGAGEVGRLSRALNRMLGEIEGALAEQTRSEDRLRAFMADASHELRTPLTVIRGYAELLRKEALPDDDARERALARIESEAARMGALVEDLLVLAKVDHEPAAAVRAVDLAAVTRDAVHDAATVEPGRSVSLSAPDAAPVLADEQRLGQVAHNLLQNALVHTPPGTPVRVRVALEADRAVLEVADDGPGMEPEAAAQVFDRFYRADPAAASKGTGLGLFIVATLVRSLGGTIELDTAPGRGARFTVGLPRAPDGAGSRSPSGAPGQPEPDGTDGRGLRRREGATGGHARRR